MKGILLCSDGFSVVLRRFQVILGSMAAGDGTFDKDSDFSASLNDGVWSVPLSAILNNTGDVLYVVPAARSKLPILPAGLIKPCHAARFACQDSAAANSAHRYAELSQWRLPVCESLGARKLSAAHALDLPATVF